jgi:hypothetical protein
LTRLWCAPGRPDHPRDCSVFSEGQPVATDFELLPACCSEGQPVATDFELLPSCLPACCSEGQPVATDFELFLTHHPHSSIHPSDRPTDRPTDRPAEGQPVEKLEINFSTFNSSADRPIDRPTDRSTDRPTAAALPSQPAARPPSKTDDLSS